MKFGPALALLVVVMSAWIAAARSDAAEPVEGGIKLAPAELRACREGGGCVLMPRRDFEQLIEVLHQCQQRRLDT